MKKIPLFLFSSILVVFFLVSTAQTQEATLESPAQIGARVQKKYDTMTSLTFNFFQQTRGELTGRPRKGSGKAAFLKKEDVQKMRWDYTQPDKQVFVGNGETFSMYFEKLKQMIISPASSIGNDITYSFFTGKGKLQDDFFIDPPDPDLKPSVESTVSVIKLIPQTPHSQVQDIHLWISDNSLIQRLHIRDHFGTITVLNLQDIILNGLSSMNSNELNQLFSYTPPDETEIIYQ